MRSETLWVRASRLKWGGSEVASETSWSRAETAFRREVVSVWCWGVVLKGVEGWGGGSSTLEGDGIVVESGWARRAHSAAEGRWCRRRLVRWVAIYVSKRG